jgi:hypothetical protein
MQPPIPLMKYMLRGKVIKKIKPKFNKIDELNIFIRKRIKTGKSRELRSDNAR